MTRLIYVCVLLAACLASFMFGRATARPSLLDEAGQALGLGRWSGVVAGAVSDARSFVDGVRLEMCLKDTQTLADANKALSERLSTSESRLGKALEDRDLAREKMREQYETNKALADKLYATSCEEWANTRVCPGISSLLSEGSEGGRGDRPPPAGGDSGKESSD